MYPFRRFQGRIGGEHCLGLGCELFLDYSVSLVGGRADLAENAHRYLGNNPWIFIFQIIDGDV